VPIPGRVEMNQSRVDMKYQTGDFQEHSMNALICVVTGSSRGIGKGIALELGRAGAIVYATGRSGIGTVTDKLLQGTVDETAVLTTKNGGVGVAVHADHSIEAENVSLYRLVSQQHKRLDVLVNNAFFIPKPDSKFFMTPVYYQPVRFLNEQHAVGGLNHSSTTVLMTPLLRRGHGLVVNISSQGSQLNLAPTFPVSYVMNKTAFDQSQRALNTYLRQYRVFSMTLWPGAINSERSQLAAKKGAMAGMFASLVDTETVKFTGKAVKVLAKLPRSQLPHFTRKSISVSDVYDFGWSHDHDGFLIEPLPDTICHAQSTTPAITWKIPPSE